MTIMTAYFRKCLYQLGLIKVFFMFEILMLYLAIVFHSFKRIYIIQSHVLNNVRFKAADFSHQGVSGKRNLNALV